jgi:uncharacterized protein
MSMKLFLDRITATPTELSFEASAPWWRERAAGARELDYEIAEPFHFDLSAHWMGETVILEGSVRGCLDLECSRCLARYRHALRDDFRLILEKAGSRVPPDPEGVESLARDGLCLMDEIETGWYRGNVIVLDGFLGEVISAAMPLHPLCSEDCMGLCPECGVSRASGDCGCIIEERPAPEPNRPFAVLAKLRDGEAGGK